MDVTKVCTPHLPWELPLTVGEPSTGRDDCRAVRDKLSPLTRRVWDLGPVGLLPLAYLQIMGQSQDLSEVSSLIKREGWVDLPQGSFSSAY